MHKKEMLCDILCGEFIGGGKWEGGGEGGKGGKETERERDREERDCSTKCV